MKQCIWPKVAAYLIWTRLSGTAVTLLLALTMIGFRTARAGWTGNIIAYVMASFISAAIVFLDSGPSI
jgi:hypothetical protein